MDEFTNERMDECRYERKFLVERLDAQQVRALVKLHPGMFYEPYPPRYVNNLYLDTVGLDNYFDNVAGVGERHKVRIRWYGELFRAVEEPVLEFKVKSGLVGSKHTYPFAPFSLDDRFCHRYYRERLEETDLPGRVKQYMRSLRVVLCNRYYRWYFATRDQRFRVTVDAEMSFCQVREAGNRFVRNRSVRNRSVRRQVDHGHVVLELKYARALDVQADRIAGFFPFGVTRNSKYVTGIERVYL